MSERKVCKICSKPNAYKVTSNDVLQHMRKQLNFVTGVQLHSENDGPLMVCEQCAQQICRSFRFKRYIHEVQIAALDGNNSDGNSNGNEADPKQQQSTTSKPNDTGK